MHKIVVKLDIEKDAWNWWHACNKVSYGVDWKMRIDEKLRNKIFGKTQKDAYAFLIPFLDEYYLKVPAIGHIKEIQDGFNKNSEKIFQRMEKVTNRPIYRENFTCFITSFPRFPYNYEEGYVWISNKKPLDSQIAIFIHELLHFQYFAYFGEKIWNELGQEAHAELKEAMTVILNEEFSDITSEKDKGYEIHRELRGRLLNLWRQERNMDNFIEKAVLLLKG